MGRSVSARPQRAWRTQGSATARGTTGSTGNPVPLPNQISFHAQNPPTLSHSPRSPDRAPEPATRQNRRPAEGMRARISDAQNVGKTGIAARTATGGRLSPPPSARPAAPSPTNPLPPATPRQTDPVASDIHEPLDDALALAPLDTAAPSSSSSHCASPHPNILRAYLGYCKAREWPFTVMVPIGGLEGECPKPPIKKTVSGEKANAKTARSSAPGRSRQ